MKSFSVILIGLAMLVALTGIAMAEQVVPAVPSHQGVSTSTVANVDGLVMESDSLAMTLTNNPTVVHTLTTATGINTPIWVGNPFALTMFNQGVAQLTAAGGSIAWHIGPFGGVVVDSLSVPDSAMTTQVVNGGPMTWGTIYAMLKAIPGVVSVDVNQGIHGGMISPGQTQYSTAYNAEIVAQNGQTNLIKQSDLNTANTVAGQETFGPKTELAFIATAPAGNVVGSEDITLVGTGASTVTSQSMLCPFGPATSTVIPPYCNIVQAGSSYDLTVGSVTTDANERFIGNDATMPTTVNYQINVKPYGQIPAYGSASAYVSAHTQEGRTASNTISQDVVYHESSSVSGQINGFTKVIKYTSGMKI